MVYGPWTIDKKSPIQAKFSQRLKTTPQRQNSQQPTAKKQTSNLRTFPQLNYRNLRPNAYSTIKAKEAKATIYM
jgi:hypothetical protein